MADRRYNSRMVGRWLLAGALGAAFLLIGVAIVTVWRASPWVHDRVVEALAARLDSEVTLASFEVSFLPRPAFVGRGLVVRYQGRTFFIGIIASNARFASAPPAASASVSTRGVICQERPQRSLHHPHWLSWPPLSTIAFQ